jgi:deoxyxylulose-5-phosphate synthase
LFEETVKSGGIGEHLVALLTENGYKGEFKIHAVENKFVKASSVDNAIKTNGLNFDAMLNAFKD